MYHEPCHTPMKHHHGLKVANALIGAPVVLSDRCCGESGTLAATRPDISTQVRFRKQEEIVRGVAAMTAEPNSSGGGTALDRPVVKILTSCPSCVQGLARYGDDAGIEADYIVVEMAKSLLGPNWLDDYVARAGAGGIERVLL